MFLVWAWVVGMCLGVARRCSLVSVGACVGLFVIGTRRRSRAILSLVHQGRDGGCSVLIDLRRRRIY